MFLAHHKVQRQCHQSVCWALMGRSTVKSERAKLVVVMIVRPSNYDFGFLRLSACSKL